ncbi:phosphonate C-P lyase system protein PhnG [Pseudorhizobium tarimense]|nr:phosphonate C-P lyase system protein PhnG [Pseudorhizobium tarimense]MCJ8517872.1 phosphonate C-P lyase system protein PhnG [Pseudorhizobium tarimense]
MTNSSSNPLAPEQEARRRAAALLARARADELSTAWEKLPIKPESNPVRGPETGLVMVRGRIGGGGAPFNLGEATVTRATVLLSSGTAGHAQSLGTDKAKVRLAAIFDALWQEEQTAAFVESEILAPVEARIQEEDRQQAEKTAATRVDFFTMVRGDD